jgi:hypothetical protein
MRKYDSGVASTGRLSIQSVLTVVAVAVVVVVVRRRGSSPGGSNNSGLPLWFKESKERKRMMHASLPSQKWRVLANHVRRLLVNQHWYIVLSNSTWHIKDHANWMVLATWKTCNIHDQHMRLVKEGLVELHYNTRIVSGLKMFKIHDWSKVFAWLETAYRNCLFKLDTWLRLTISIQLTVIVADFKLHLQQQQWKPSSTGQQLILSDIDWKKIILKLNVFQYCHSLVNWHGIWTGN